MTTSHAYLRPFLRTVLIGTSVLLAGCGDSSEQTAAGAKWLTETHEIPADSGWKKGEVTVDGDGIFLAVDLNSVTRAKSLKSFSAMDKGNIARLACPAPETEFWELAGKSATLSITLNSMGEKLVQAVCRRPR